MAKSSKDSPGIKVIADNRKARRDYFIDDVVEAGLVLIGTEVKSLRGGHASLSDAYAAEEDGELYLLNCYIPEYASANRFNHAPRRRRKLLLNRREIRKLAGAVQRKGITLVPLKLYFNERGIVKTEIALARGKKLYDKRQTDKDRKWARDKARLMREKG
jgi:SsrA-binding protein